MKTLLIALLLGSSPVIAQVNQFDNECYNLLSEYESALCAAQSVYRGAYVDIMFNGYRDDVAEYDGQAFYRGATYEFVVSTEPSGDMFSPLSLVQQ